MNGLINKNMLVKEIVAELLKQNQESEAFMFHKSADGKLSFTSDISSIAHGMVYDEYGNQRLGVLIEKK